MGLLKGVATTDSLSRVLLLHVSASRESREMIMQGNARNIVSSFQPPVCEEETEREI